MILDDILKVKEQEVKNLPLAMLKAAVKNVSPANAFPAKKDGFMIIAEIKKASPSKGVLKEDLDPVVLAKQYLAGGAKAVSVLTDRQFFQGHLDYIRRIKTEVDIPILRKDFIISEAQIYESRIAGADAILLIARILDEDQLSKFVDLSKSLGMSCVVEVHDDADVVKALKTNADIIGINNRDLNNFEVDIRTTLGILKNFPQLKEKTLIAESGIKSKQEIDVLKTNGVAGALIGESLIKAADPAAKLKEFLA
ncbi:MAG: indole-3-glycerol phosphate synthase TrpC [Candidatus Margulisbacteria bacterium]|nr:indole-3-glycerol phosphate synthase TrpC [Candidatus Margulisiibacteriota bacterium]MBU1022402.1 indole-3-glycerol phosphate synthase TrpC [Candidatus Margulisiibacteriota bacterium]MBU1729046.1 indole-3-glycerol phosphate synthase TrpC [Candidatus Margulisiibacteriota bacterium]MBU1954533.1 indole-3-glycerol phosphate synthase TrpC [Candidatus Margulisiibacteriota bacterium]